ncbi:hypothetical protein PI124_g17463 [Phytophthora idaei]|nr:hypothetical protein PI124_g17463 [Phytophthora idaei]
MVVVAEGGGFVVERASFCSVPPISTDVQPPSTSKTDPLSTFEFVVVWLLVLALHGLCASYLLAMALLYFFMENPLMVYYANLLALPEHRYFRLFGTLVGILGALHGLQLVLHLLWSIKSRAPAVFPRAAMINRLVRGVLRLKKSKKTEPVAPRPSWSRNSITAIGSVTASGLQSVLSVEGNHFALVFVTRKAVEVGAQIVQCYRYSTLIGRVWINQAYAAKWGSEAALNADLHPEMVFLIMVYTNMTEMPRDLLTTPLPLLLGDIEISITNLTAIPEELAAAWSNVRLVYLEHAPLKEFPTALLKIPSLSVSLIDDGLESIPDDLFMTESRLDEYLEIAFSYNPIKELPSSIRDGLLVNYLSVDHTEVTELPAWVDGIGQWMNLGGTPVCNDTKAVIPDIADCTDWGWNPMADGRYPLALVAPLREIV